MEYACFWHLTIYSWKIVTIMMMMRKEFQWIECLLKEKYIFFKYYVVSSNHLTTEDNALNNCLQANLNCFFFCSSLYIIYKITSLFQKDFFLRIFVFLSYKFQIDSLSEDGIICNWSYFLIRKSQARSSFFFLLLMII